MPQLNTATFLSQAFWLIISFMMMWLIVCRFIVPKINDIIRQRQHKVDNYIIAADEFRQQAEKLSSRYNAALSLAEKESAQYLAEVESALAEHKRELQLEMKEKLERQKLENEDYLRQIKDSIETQIEDLASVLAEKILVRLNLTPRGYQEVAAAIRKDKNND